MVWIRRCLSGGRRELPRRYPAVSLFSSFTLLALTSSVLKLAVKQLIKPGTCLDQMTTPLLRLKLAVLCFSHHHQSNDRKRQPLFTGNRTKRQCQSRSGPPCFEKKMFSCSSCVSAISTFKCICIVHRSGLNDVFLLSTCLTHFFFFRFKHI